MHVRFGPEKGDAVDVPDQRRDFRLVAVRHADDGCRGRRPTVKESYHGGGRFVRKDCLFQPKRSGEVHDRYVARCPLTTGDDVLRQGLGAAPDQQQDGFAASPLTEVAQRLLLTLYENTRDVKKNRWTGINGFRKGHPVKFQNLHGHRGQDGRRAGLVGEQPHLSEDVPTAQAGDGPGRGAFADDDLDDPALDQVQAIGNLAFPANGFAGGVAPRFHAIEDLVQRACGQAGKERRDRKIHSWHACTLGAERSP